MVAKRPPQGLRGITLVEMMVVVAIFSMVSSVLFFNYSKFRDNISIRTLSQEVGLAIRKAQSYATGVSGVTNQASREFPHFGISFQVGVPLSWDLEPDAKEFVIFADLRENGGADDPNAYYDNLGNDPCGEVSEGNECFEKFSITTPDRVSKLCWADGACFTDTPGQGGQVHVVFRRPNPDAWFCKIPEGSTTCDGEAIDYLIVELLSIRNITKKVKVWTTGQISVE